jgi:DNA-directed RNA polymerase specialized sigma24 family protein
LILATFPLDCRKPQLHGGWGSANMNQPTQRGRGAKSVDRGRVGEDLKTQWRRLYDFALRRVRDPHVSEDIAQETLSRLTEFERDQVVDNRSALGFTIARNLLRDHFRARRPAEILDESLPSPDPLADEVVLQRQYLAAVQAVIDAMPPLRREIFLRRRFGAWLERSAFFAF